MAITTLCNFINGEFVSPKSGQYIDNISPATSEVISRIPRSTAEDVELATNSAASTFKAGTWKNLSANERADWLEKVAKRIEEKFEHFVELEALDCGKPKSLARAVDIPRAVDNFRFFAAAIRTDSTRAHLTQGANHAINYTLRQPIGVAGLITPWNLPLYLLSWKVAPALATGNSVVAKPSELTPLTANALAEVFAEIGFPKGAFNVVHGYGAECGQAILEHPRIRLISFTGGTVTGQKVAITTGPLFKKVSLELGGKNATIVFADSDFDLAVEGAKRAAFANQGQVCLCGSRILVERSIYDRFVARFVELLKTQTVVGDPLNPATNVGALISQAHRQKVESYVELGKQEGGTIVYGGKRPDLPEPFSNGFFLEPTVFTGLPINARTCTEEIFGPVVTIHPFDTEDEAVEAANLVRYGLSASVWTTNLTRAHRVSANLESGMVWVNTWLLRDLRVPFGGVKDSGVGREGGNYSLEFYTEDKNVCIKL